MPRPPADLSRIAATDLLYAVSQLIAAGKTNAAEVQRFAHRRAARVAAIQDELRALHAGQASAARRGPGPGRPAGQPATRKARRKFTMTPKALAARVLQGRYLGRLRKLTGANRAKVKALAKEQSVAAAVKLADTILA